MQSLILIPARAGSTRVHNKNIRVLGDKPLVGHVVMSARESSVGRVVVSTNSSEIAHISNHYGAEIPFFRPDMLSGATAASLWVILHALQMLREAEARLPDFLAYCPPTTPFLKSDTIIAMRDLLVRRPEVNSVVTITRAKTHPFRIVGISPDGKLQVGAIFMEGKSIFDIERSQDWPMAYEGSPACRMTRVQYFLPLLEGDCRERQGRTYDPCNCLGYEIDPVEAFDIDTESDWNMAEALQNLRGKVLLESEK